MLILSRERSEEVVVGDNLLRMMLVDIRGDKVRLGFAADKGLSVHRAEVFDAIKRDGRVSDVVRDTIAAFMPAALLLLNEKHPGVQFARTLGINADAACKPDLLAKEIAKSHELGPSQVFEPAALEAWALENGFRRSAGNEQ